jgi:hypothetical protein
MGYAKNVIFYRSSPSHEKGSLAAPPRFKDSVVKSQFRLEADSDGDAADGLVAVLTFNNVRNVGSNGDAVGSGDA